METVFSGIGAVLAAIYIVLLFTKWKKMGECTLMMHVFKAVYSAVLILSSLFANNTLCVALWSCVFAMDIIGVHEKVKTLK